MTCPASILVVDDNEKNRLLLNEYIIALGHTPLLAENGLSALAQIRKQPPDLVLLDIMMPVMDGYEVLEHLKNDSNLRHLPVIMITAVDEMESVVRCIEKGADDYLTKPFNPTLLNARISACLEKKRLRDQEEKYRRKIEQFNLHLEDLVMEKTTELREAHERLSILDKAKSEFLNIISHELRTPLTGLIGVGELLLEEDLDDASRKELKEAFQQSSKHTLALTDQALLLTQIQVSGDAFQLKTSRLDALLASSVALASELAKSRQVLIEQVPECDILVECEKDLFTKAVAALLETAVKLSTERNKVNISCESSEDEIHINIRAYGRDVPEGVLDKIFEVFIVADAITPGGDLGLGLPFARRILELFKGKVTATSLDPAGVLFTVIMPHTRGEGRAKG